VQEAGTRYVIGAAACYPWGVIYRKLHSAQRIHQERDEANVDGLGPLTRESSVHAETIWNGWPQVRGLL
jgi:hypothetical protein